MIDFEITFQADELSYEDYEKMSHVLNLISEIMFRKFLRQFKTKTALPPQQSLNTPCCQQNVSAIMDLAFWFQAFLRLLAAFNFIRIGPIYQKLCSFKH